VSVFSKGNDLKSYDVAVVGGGPGGLMAAVYLKRFWRSVVVFDEGVSRATLIPTVHNLVGHSDGVSGRFLLRDLKKQLRALRIPVVNERARVRVVPSGFKIETSRGDWKVKKVILATGMRDIQPTLKNYRKLCLSGALAYCPVCDGFDHSGEELGVWVKGPECVGKIKYLFTFSPKLHVFMSKAFVWPRGERQVLEKAGIKFYDSLVRRLLWRPKEKSLTVFTEDGQRVALSLMYVELGTEVPSHAIHGLKSLKRTEAGFLQVNYKQETSMPGLFAVGDCVDALSQISVAMGHAAVAASAIHNQLLTWKRNPHSLR
jgi:thioredoxin reductase (NADPH)